MPERLYLQFDNRFDVPPAYAFAWLTDFRPEDIRHVGGAKQPLIKVTRLPDGRIQREFQMMGMDMVTRSTLEPSGERWVAIAEARNKKGVLQTVNRIVETVRPDGTGTAHHVDFYQEDHTTMSKLMAALTKPMTRSYIQKIFDVNKRDMEAAFKAGKPATS